MSPSLRRFALTVHITTSIGWIGAVAAYVVLDVTVVTSDTLETLRASYLAMDLITKWMIVPLAYAALVTGLVMSLGTKWGLFRHWWVVLSLVLTLFALAVLLSEARTIAFHAAVAADPTTTDAELRALGSTLLHSVLGMLVLLLVTVLNVYKPRGLTRYGWRKQQAERRQVP